VTRFIPPRARVLAWCLLLLLGLAPAISRSAQPAAGEHDQSRKTSGPYTGDLSIFEYKDRDQKLQVERVMDILGISAGKTVADIGAGSGWFSVRAARRVTPAGVVYAVDINQEAILYIQNRASRERMTNVHAVLSQPDDPMLPADSIDAALLLKTYHEVADPVALLKNLHRSLRPKARLGIIDRNGNGADHGVNREVVIREAREAGFKLIQDYDFVKADREDYFLVFEPI